MFSENDRKEQRRLSKQILAEIRLIVNSLSVSRKKAAWLRATAERFKLLWKAQNRAKTAVGYNLQYTKALLLLTDYPERRLVVRPGTKDAKALRMLGSARKLLRRSSRWNDILGLDLDMVALQLNDAADHLEIACLLHAGKMRQAVRLASRLNTASREEIPQRVWSCLGISRIGGFILAPQFARDFAGWLQPTRRFLNK